jgi:hypothetical protein
MLPDLKIQACSKKIVNERFDCANPISLLDASCFYAIILHEKYLFLLKEGLFSCAAEIFQKSP